MYLLNCLWLSHKWITDGKNYSWFTQWGLNRTIIHSLPKSDATSKCWAPELIWGGPLVCENRWWRWNWEGCAKPGVCGCHPESQGSCVCLWVWRHQQRMPPNTALNPRPANNESSPGQSSLLNLNLSPYFPVFIITIIITIITRIGVWGDYSWPLKHESLLSLPSLMVPPVSGRRGLVWTNQLGTSPWA